jgi:hypothetical protein
MNWIIPLLLINGSVGLIGDRAADACLILKPEAFKTLVNPDCSHCRDEAKRRAQELRDDDPVLCWIRDTKGQYQGGAIPIRFFLNPYRVISDSYGVFVYDPDAGYARGFAPSYDFAFAGWRDGVMVMRHKDGTLYSCLTGLAFDGPKKGTRLAPVPTLTSKWGSWLRQYPGSVAYHMYDKYQPTELPQALNADSRRSRRSADARLAADEPVLGVYAGPQARAYPLKSLIKAGLVEDSLNGEAVVVLWEAATETAAAYHPLAVPPAGNQAPVKVTLMRDGRDGAGPVADKETGSHWDIAGRATDGKLKGWTLQWLDSVQVKWFAWAAEYPHTSIHGVGAARAPMQARPLQAVIAEPGQITHVESARKWKREGFQAVAVVLDDNQDAAALREVAATLAGNSLDLYLWIEVGRSPALARKHPQWMASLGMHDDWRKHFPEVRPLQKGEVAKAWPWVPISYQESFAAHLARIKGLLASAPAEYRGLLLNDLQAGPASCGCGNLQCRWAVDYGVPSTTTKLSGPDVAARFVAEVHKLAPGKPVIPVWTPECDLEDLAGDQGPQHSWSTGHCGTVPCFLTCRKRFTEQWSSLTTNHHDPVGLLLLHRELQRDRKEYGTPAGWIKHGADYVTKLDVQPLPPSHFWLVIQGYDVTAEEEKAARRLAAERAPGAVLVARTRIDQSYEPRIATASR